MTVADTSALLSLTTGEIFETMLEAFDVHTTETVVEELKNTSEYRDRHGKAAQKVLDQLDRITVHTTDNRSVQSSRIDDGEVTCVTLVRELDADFLITDDYRALPELQTLVRSKVAVSPILLKALVKKDVLTLDEARNRFERMAENRDWLEAPIYRHATQLFDEK